MAALRRCRHCGTQARYLKGIERLCVRCYQQWKEAKADERREARKLKTAKPRTYNAEPLVYEEVRRRRKLEPELTMSALAERYGLNPVTVSKILHAAGLTNRDDQEDNEGQ